MLRRLLLSTCSVLPLALLMLPGVSAQAQPAAGPIVTVSGGKIQGALLPAPGGAVFKGIPFAAPPVGELRWREPQPVKPWNGVRPATDYAATCAQFNMNWNKLAVSKESEDCLYLNVWAPEWPVKTKKAVMVWIHGGANMGGSALGQGGIEPPFDGASLARRGVVVVTIQYRLGLLGFMGHPELTAESPHHASGGYGILDQIAALRWVHDNIARFGGNPANVTVFGQSAGAQDTTILVASPLTKGLITKAIAESGTPMIGDKRLQSPAQMQELGETLAQLLKAPEKDPVKYLRSLPVEQIVAATPEFRKAIAEKHLILDVGMDGYAVPEFSPEVYRSGQEAPVPLMIGSNGKDNPGAGRTNPNATPAEQMAEVKTRVETVYGKYPDLLERALAVYGLDGSRGEISTYPPYGGPARQFGVDLSMRCEADTLAGWHSALAPTYQYEFNAGTPDHPPVHSAELDYVFGFLGDQAAEPNLVKLSQQMQTYWTNFAKSGDPNGAALPNWPRYDSKSRDYVNLSNEGVQAKQALRKAQCAIYTEKLTRDLNARKQP
jgi:para-nitrobenzyl esterase